MKTLKNSILIASLFLLVSTTFYAQNSIQGDIANWSNGEVPLIFNDYISKEKITMGNIATDGKMTIPLDENFLTKMKEAAIQAKEKAPQGWEMKFNTVESSFNCSDEGIVYENAEVILSGLPDLEVLSEDGTTSYGYLYCTNSLQLSSWLQLYGMVSVAKGYYLKWFFVEDAASVKGSCNIPTYTGNDDENYMNTTIYDVKLQKGWNIIKYEITETFTSKDGKIAPAKTQITRIDKIPDDVQWLLL